MSKKAQKNQLQKKETDIVEQQKDPMLRALQKKVRNMNKKLNEITELATRKDLKPEQEQKISKKAQIVQQKEKYNQMIEIYKQISGESEKVIRKMQLTELEDLASLIAVKEFAGDLGFLFNQYVDNLVRILTSPTSNNLTLKQRLDEINNALSDAANNTKLKKSLRQFVLANPAKQRGNLQSISNKEEPPSPESQKQRQEEIKQLEKEQKIEKCQRVVATVTIPTIEPPVPLLVCPAPTATTVQAVNPTFQEKKKEQSVAPVSETVTEQKKQVEKQSNSNNQPEKTIENNKETTEQTDQKQERRGGYRGYRGDNRGGRGNGRFNDERKPYNNEDRKPYKKPSFKPKYQENKQAKDDDSSLEPSDQEPQAREFKRQQVRQLIEDGFIVVGKPKQKARDQQQYYDHQHGKKHHHHQSKKNY